MPAARKASPQSLHQSASRLARKSLPPPAAAGRRKGETPAFGKVSEGSREGWEGPVAGQIKIAAVSAAEFLKRMDDGFFPDFPGGHFWLEHLVRVLASQRARRDSVWRLWAASEEGAPFTALYAVSTESRYALFHATDVRAGASLLRWAVEHEPPLKVLSPYMTMERALERAGLKERVTRDHRELLMAIGPGELAVKPDWNYRLATERDIPRLVEYNELYNRERATNWTRDWRECIAQHAVYVRERDGRITSCLIRGAVLGSRVSLGGTFTFPEYRGQGEATMLVANFCAEMALFDYDVCLIVDDDNFPALRVYAKVGFTPVGLFRTTYFAAPQDRQDPSEVGRPPSGAGGPPG